MSWRVRDVIWGDILLSEEEKEILDTFEMQRLRGIKQLDFASLVYPGAEHTRFQHSLGVRACIERILKTSNIQIQEENLKLLKVASLIHDVATPIYSHIVSDLFRRFYSKIIPPHEKFVNEVLESVCYNKFLDRYPDFYGVDVKPIREVLQNQGFSKMDLKKIINIITGTFKPRYISQLVNGPVDADMLDYLRRDAHFTGVPQGYDDRIFAVYTLNEDYETLTLRERHDTLAAVASVIESRFWMMKKVYLHPTVLAANCLIIEMLLKALGEYDFYELFYLDDSQIMSKFMNLQNSEVRELASRIRYRKLPKRAYVAPLRNLPNYVKQASSGFINYHDLIDKIAEEANKIDPKNEISREDIYIYLPKDYYKAADIMVGDFSYEDFDPITIKELKERYKTLMVVYIYSSEEKHIEPIYRVCTKTFGVDSEYNPFTKRPFIKRKRRINQELRSFLDNLREEHNYVIELLYTLAKQNGHNSRDDLAKIMEVNPTTISTYLQKVYKAQKNQLKNQVLIRKRFGRKIVWLINPDIRENLLEEIQKTSINIIK
ncbi:MAG: HD domain-containing protein [Candidatus Lokiarchaeia archaeon]